MRTSKYQRCLGIRITLIFLVLTKVVPGSTPHGESFAITPAVLPGQVAPGSDGGRFSSIRTVALNNAGIIAFGAAIDGGRATSGLYLFFEGSLMKIALAGPLNPGGGTGDPAPGTAGGAFGHDFGITPVSINNKGEVAFNARVLGGYTPDLVGIFLYSRGEIRPIVLEGSSPPNSTAFLTAPCLNDRGEILFSDRADLGALRIYANGAIQTIVSKDLSAPGTGGNSFAKFLDFDLNNRGEVAFHASLVSGNLTSGIFLLSQNNISPVAVTGQTVPQNDSKLFDNFSRVQIADSGEVAFRGEEFVSFGSFGNPIYRPFGLFVSSKEALKPVVIVGQQVAGGDRDVFSSIGTSSMNRQGVIFCTASIRDKYRAFFFMNDVLSPIFFFFLLREDFLLPLALDFPHIVSANDSNTILLTLPFAVSEASVGQGVLLASPHPFPRITWFLTGR